MKKKTGLNGAALAAKLETDPEACFTEMPHCPYCKVCAEEVAEGLPLAPDLPTGDGEKNPLIELMGAGLFSGPLVLGIVTSPGTTTPRLHSWCGQLAVRS